MRQLSFFIIWILLSSCSNEKKASVLPVDDTKLPSKDQFILSFASCNNQLVPNKLWGPILSHHPDLFIWGGDIIYADTENMAFMQENYDMMKQDSSYAAFEEQVPVIGTWDDHDYGLNDGGVHYKMKDSVQQLFLDFFDVPKNDKRRKQKGIYDAQEYGHKGAVVKVIILDTRYFRSDLSKDETGKKRYIPNSDAASTMLGETQWAWLKSVLNNSKAQFNVIVSSIQFLSGEHGFESWGNMPHEVEKMKKLLVESKARGLIFLSGDRHIAEISSLRIPGLDYPIIDVTSSGMTHSYTSFTSEPNQYRVGEVVADKNFGVLTFDFDKNTINIEIRGEDDVLYQEFMQQY